MGGGGDGPGQRRFARDDRLDPSGHPNNPKREAALRAKYAGLAKPVLGNSGAERLATEVDRLDRSSGRRLVELLAVAP